MALCVIGLPITRTIPPPIPRHKNDAGYIHNHRNTSNYIMNTLYNVLVYM